MMVILDTDVLSQLVRKRPSPALMERIRATPGNELHTTVVTVMELRYGSARRADHEAFWRRISESILSRVHILGFGTRAALLAADLRAWLEARGLPIGQADVMIAAIALAHDCAVVTRNVSHFERIPGLAVEQWG